MEPLDDNQPSPALARHFQVVGVVPGRVAFPGHGTVDLRTLSLAQARQLFAAGFPYLARVAQPTGPPAQDPPPDPAPRAKRKK